MSGVLEGQKSQNFDILVRKIEGPKVWIDLNKKCEAKVIGFINKNKVKAGCEKEHLLFRLKL